MYREWKYKGLNVRLIYKIISKEGGNVING